MGKRLEVDPARAAMHPAVPVAPRPCSLRPVGSIAAQEGAHDLTSVKYPVPGMRDGMLKNRPVLEALHGELRDIRVGRFCMAQCRLIGLRRDIVVAVDMGEMNGAGEPHAALPGDKGTSQ